MRKIVDQQAQENIRVTVFDDDTAKIDAVVPGEIISINWKKRLEDSFGRSFYYAQVNVELKSGKFQKGSAKLWEFLPLNSVYAEERLLPGGNINLAIEVKGSAQGCATIELPDYRQLYNQEIQNIIESELWNDNELRKVSGEPVIQSSTNVKENFSEGVHEIKEETISSYGILVPIICAIFFLLFMVNVFFTGMDNIETNWLMNTILTIGAFSLLFWFLRKV